MRGQAERGASFRHCGEKGVGMLATNASATRRSASTPSGDISYIEQGTGLVALFVHGVLLNSHLWRHQLSELSDIRRCIAVDLLAMATPRSRLNRRFRSRQTR